MVRIDIKKKKKKKHFKYEELGEFKEMVGTFVVKVFLLFILNFLGAFPLNKKSYLTKENTILKNYSLTQYF